VADNFVTLEQAGGCKDPFAVAAREDPSTAARSRILEFDVEVSPFFPDNTKWRKLRAKKTEQLNKRFNDAVEVRMKASQLCCRLLGENGVQYSTKTLRNKINSSIGSLSSLADEKAIADEFYLWRLVDTLLMFEELGTSNPLLNSMSLKEGWLGAHLHSRWIDCCFFSLSDMTSVLRSEIQSGTSQARKSEQQGSDAWGAKVDMLLHIKDIKTDTKGHHAEAFFLEAKVHYPNWSASKVREDRLKLQKEMNDAFYALIKSLYFKYNPLIKIFGAQTVGLESRIYVLDASICHMADFSELYSFNFPAEVSKKLESVLKAGCVMLEIRDQILRWIEFVTALQRSSTTIGSTNHGDSDGRAGRDGPNEPDGKDRNSPRGHDPNSQMVNYNPPMSAQTPNKKGGQTTDLSYTIESDLQEDPKAPRLGARCGQPWYVECAVLKSNGAPVAVKKLRVGWSEDEYLIREVSLLSIANQLKVRHVVPLLATFEPRLTLEPLRFAMVFPRLLPLNNSEKLRSLSLEEVQQITHQLNVALFDLHRIRILHLDVSTSNVMLDPVTGTVQLIDFGHAEVMYPGFTFIYNCGTTGYRAPEAQIGQPGGAHCDIYSAGVVLLHLLIPFIFSNAGDASLPSKVDEFLWEWRENQGRETLVQLVRKKAKETIRSIEAVHGRKDDMLLLHDLCTTAVNQTRYSVCRRATYYGVTLGKPNGIASSEPQPRSRLEELTATAPLSGLLFRRYVTSSL